MAQRRKKKNSETRIIPIIAIFLIIIIAGTIFTIKKYAPTKEHMDIEKYFSISGQDGAAVIFNGEYDPKEEDQNKAIILNDTPFFELSYLKSAMDDGYVYDHNENILRYVTESQVISASPGNLSYTQERDTIDFGADIIMVREAGVYINAEFIKLFTDFNYIYTPNPNRVAVEIAGTKKKVGQISRDTAIRQFGGPKSLILKDALKGDNIRVLEDYGKWSKVLTDDGVIGCLPNRCISKTKEETVQNNLPKREYSHNLMDKKITMVWHQVFNTEGNGNLDRLLANTSGVNVVSPTWYRIKDNAGNISSISSSEYVNNCHSRGIKVWALVNNFEGDGVDTTTVLNRTSSRDNLVNSLIAAAIADNVDGINVDFESLSIDVKDGFIEFIRELSIKCKNNGIILSVDNYKPEDHTQFYNRREQAKYADYVIVMSYDEHHGDSKEAGSNSSLPFVTEAVTDTLEQVPNEQLIVALPFYTRIWTGSGDSISNKSMGMSESLKIPEKYNAEKVWLSKEEQYYVKYNDAGKTYEVWLEDEESLSRKLSLVKENSLAGVSFWKLGFEPSTIWDIVSNYNN